MGNIKDKRPVDKNGLRHGEWFVYWNNGNLDYRENSVHGILHGSYESYYSDGRLWRLGNYNMGRQIGYWYYDYQSKRYYLCLI